MDILETIKNINYADYWLLIAVGVIILIFAIIGCVKGFVKTAFSLGSVILTLVLVMLINPYVSDFLKEHTPLYDVIKEACVEEIEDKSADQIEEFEEKENKKTTQKTKEKTTDAKKDSDAMEAIDITETIRLPKSVEKFIDDKVSDVKETVGQKIDEAVDYSGGCLADVIVRALSFIITFLLITLILRLTVFTLDAIANLPGLHSLNKLLGFILGIVEGLVIVWIILVIIFICFRTSLGELVMEQVDNSAILKFIYDNNLIMNFITGFIK